MELTYIETVEFALLIKAVKYEAKLHQIPNSTVSRLPRPSPLAYTFQQEAT